MQTHAPAQQAKQNQSHAEHKPHQSAQPQFEDARPEATAQLRLQSLMANSAQSTQLKSTQAMMAASTPVRNLGQALSATNPVPVQRMEDEELLQAKAEESIQREQAEAASPKPNNTGLPDNLKTGIENLSGIRMDHVRVHYNSDKPAQLQAHAYAQGSEIHVAPGQEKHLPHEAWHVVQQAQGRVRPTVQMKGGVGVNDDEGLEREADVMGAWAVQMVAEAQKARPDLASVGLGGQLIVQREYAEATCVVAGHKETASSKGAYKSHWVSDAMNTVASVVPKLVPGERSGEWVEVAGNAKLQCAEPKSLSLALRNGLNKDDQITEEELVGIEWENIKWKEGHRDNDPACPCPTCKTWMNGEAGSASPLDTALAAVRVAGQVNKKYFEDDDARDEFNEKKRLAAEAKQRKIAEYEKDGKYIEILGEAGCDEPYHEIIIRVNAHRAQLTLYVEYNEKMQEMETEILKLDDDIKISGTQQKKTLKENKIKLEKEVEKIKLKMGEIMEAALA